LFYPLNYGTEIHAGRIHGLDGVEQVAHTIGKHFNASFALDSALKQNY